MTVSSSDLFPSSLDIVHNKFVPTCCHQQRPVADDQSVTSFAMILATVHHPPMNSVFILWKGLGSPTLAGLSGRFTSSSVYWKEINAFVQAPDHRQQPQQRCPPVNQSIYMNILHHRMNAQNHVWDELLASRAAVIKGMLSSAYLYGVAVPGLDAAA